MIPVYTLRFQKAAEEEWFGLDKGIRERFLKVLERRLVEPRVPSAELRADLQGLYKIKLQKSGHRLVYEIKDDVYTVLVIAVGKHDTYRTAAKRAD